METQASATIKTPIRPILQGVVANIPVIAVISASDDDGKSCFASEIVVELNNLGKKAELMSLNEKCVGIHPLPDTEVLVLNCSMGLNNINLNVVSCATIIVVVLSIASVPRSITDSYQLLKSLYRDGHYSNGFELVITDCANKDEGLKVFDTLSKITSRFCELMRIELLSMLFDKPGSDSLHSCINKAAVSLIKRMDHSR